MIVENQPMADYLADEGIGSSTLKTILESPKDFQYQLKKSKKPTSAQTKGTLWHSFMIEPDKYLSEYAVQPEDWGPLNQNPGKSKWDEFKKLAAEQGKTPVKYAEAGDLCLLQDEMKNHGALKQIMKTYKPEVSFYAEHEGIKLKSREDIWCYQDGSVWDVKTTSKLMNSSKELDENLEDIIFTNGYHFSAAHHMKVMELCGVEVNSWGWIFVSTGTPAPHIVIKKASTELVEAGKTDWRHAFRLLQECQKANLWPGFDDEIHEIGLPRWAERKYYSQ